jgi:hypothetical protein
MPIRKTRRSDLMRFNKIQLIKEIERWKGMYAASIEQTEKAQYVELELEQYKGYLKDNRERLVRVRKERDLAIELLRLRLTPLLT